VATAGRAGGHGGPGQPWLLFANGQDGSQDYVQVRQWHEKAAAQGNPKAQSNLGALYGNGKGVPQDYQQALRWFRLASNQGNASGLITLGIMYEHGYGVTQGFVQAHKWYNLGERAEKKWSGVS
jgi:TPR repeat protein